MQYSVPKPDFIRLIRTALTSITESHAHFLHLWSMMTDSNLPTAGIIRRIAAIVYDTLLLLAVLFVATAIAVAINKGQAVSHPLYYLSLAAICYLFFCWFWTHGGQTLGMRTWRLKLITNSKMEMTWSEATKRFLLAVIALLPFGAGLLWLLFDSERLAFHDRLSDSKIVYIPKGQSDADNG